MQRYNDVPPELSSRKTNVPNNDYQTTSWHQSPPHTFPHSVNRVQKLLVVVYMTELIGMFRILLQCPVGGRCNRQMDRLLRQFRYDLSGITQQESVSGRHFAQQRLNSRSSVRISGYRWNRALSVTTDQLHEVTRNHCFQVTSNLTDITSADYQLTHGIQYLTLSPIVIDDTLV